MIAAFLDFTYNLMLNKSKYLKIQKSAMHPGGYFISHILIVLRLCKAKNNSIIANFYWHYSYNIYYGFKTPLLLTFNTFNHEKHLVHSSRNTCYWLAIRHICLQCRRPYTHTYCVGYNIAVAGSYTTGVI